MEHTTKEITFYNYNQSLPVKHSSDEFFPPYTAAQQ